LLAALGMLDARDASAAPAGGLYIAEERCEANGTVSALLAWTPSGSGVQYVDLAVRNDGFSSTHSTGGPYAANVNQVWLTQLQPGAAYYARVRTAEGGGFSTSGTISYVARCTTGGVGTGSITPPANLQAAATGQNSLRFQWNAGQNNYFFCLNTATSQFDLQFGGPSWRNHGCGTNSTVLQLNNVPCGTTYWWNVWAWSPFGTATSYTAVVQSASCSIGAPANLRALDVRDDVALLAWTPGANNIWYCVNLARSEHDLRYGGPSWFNAGCWTTQNSLWVGGLRCDTTYYWNVFTWNYSTSTTSGMSTFETDACETHLEEAPIDDIDIRQEGDNYWADVIAVLPNGCHEFEDYEVEYSGNTIEITVLNRVYESTYCTLEYREYELNIDLGDDFDPGETYEVVVNGEESEDFTVPAP
jgi:hypothetical protein